MKCEIIGENGVSVPWSYRMFDSSYNKRTSLKNMEVRSSRVVVVHDFNSSTEEAEIGGSL